MGFIVVMTIVPAFMPLEVNLDRGKLIDTTTGDTTTTYEAFTQCELPNISETG